MFSSIWQRPCIAEADNMHVTNHESDIQGTIDQPPSISPNDCESTILARRVLPSLRIPVSKSTMPVSQRGPASGSERSDSPYTRRSVTGMKRLMPLRLASPQVSPRPSPQSEFDLAFSEAPRSFNFIYDQRQDPSDSRYVPWMQFETDSPLLNDLDSRKFRETPIYSEPGSPFLARAYFSDENDCPKCLPPGSPCRNVCIVESYGDIAEMQSPQLEYNTDHVESFDGESEAGTESSEYESVSTGLTSLPSSSLSDLSIKCRGLEVMQFEPFWVESTPAPWLAPALEEQKELVTQRYPAESWIASESSRCSSPVCISEVLSAYATPLAPAKPNVVHVRSPESPLNSPARTTCFPRPTTPRGWATRKMSVLDSPPVTPVKERYEEIPPMPRLPAPLDLLSCFESAANGHYTPPVSPLGSPFQSALNYTRSVPRHRFNVHDLAEEVINLPLIEAICDGIDGSPRDLQLDTFCITEIRRRNQQSRSPAVPKCSATLVDGYFPLPQRHLSRGSLHRNAKTTSFFTPLKPVKEEVTLRPSISHSLSASSIRPLADSKSINLSALLNIFPNSDDWWRGVLYAHLLAYNYVAETHNIYLSSSTISGTSSKVSRVLGLPRGSTPPELTAVRPRFVAEKEDDRIAESFVAILNGLASCISRIVGCMAGDYERMRDTVKGMRVERADHLLVKSLAEVVKMVEMNIPDVPRSVAVATG